MREHLSQEIPLVGVQCIWLPELDGGPVLAKTEVEIQKNETVRSLASKVLTEEHKLYPKVL